MCVCVCVMYICTYIDIYLCICGYAVLCVDLCLEVCKVCVRVSEFSLHYIMCVGAYVHMHMECIVCVLDPSNVMVLLSACLSSPSPLPYCNVQPPAGSTGRTDCTPDYYSKGRCNLVSFTSSVAPTYQVSMDG